jgi:hypothetical protein
MNIVKTMPKPALPVEGKNVSTTQEVE